METQPLLGTDLVLLRYHTSHLGTRGILYLHGKPLWHTLEDPDRLAAGLPKLAKDTAIPAAIYQWAKTRSTRFRKVTPLLADVPLFTGIRIHAGNTKADTEGCILIGARIGRFAPFGSASIVESRDAFAQLMAWTAAAGNIQVVSHYPNGFAINDQVEGT